MDFKHLQKFIGLVAVPLLLLLPKSYADTCKRPPNKHRLDYIVCPHDGLSRVEKNDKTGFVDMQGNIVIQLDFDEAKSFSEGLAEVKLAGKRFFIDTQGRKRIELPEDVEAVSEFKEGLVAVKKNHRIGFMDKAGKMAVHFQYNNASDFREGLAVVVVDGKQGFINQSGILQIPLKYDEATKFFDGLASVRIADKWGVINQNNELIIPMIYDFIGFFKDSETTDAQLNGKWVKIDKKGNQIQTNSERDFRQGMLHKKVLDILNRSRNP